MQFSVDGNVDSFLTESLSSPPSNSFSSDKCKAQITVTHVYSGALEIPDLRL